MSGFTTQVRWICEQAYNTAHPDTPGTIAQYLEAGRAAIFGFQYPIFDANYKGVLETKILKHYYTREISEETVALWKLRLDSKMNEIMPYYNKLYQSELLQFNPLYDVDVEKTGQRSGTQEKSEIDSGSLSGRDTMTGTVGDSGSKSGTTSMSGISSTDKTVSNATAHTGTVTDAGTKDITRTETGTVTDSGTTGNTKTRTGTEETVESTIGNTTTEGAVVTKDRGTVARENTGTDIETTDRDNTNDHWDYYSDTPQGTIGFIPGSTGTPQADASVRDQTYLTNVRHITDNTTGSQEEKSTVHGLTTTDRLNTDKTVETDMTEGKASETNKTLTLNTTEQDNGTSGNTRTLNTSERTAGTEGNTRTLNNTDTTTGTEGIDGTTSENGTSSETSANTRTYDTVNTRSDTTSATRAGSYENMDEYTEHVRGKQGGSSFSKMLIEFRETFLNIDMLIIEDLGELFFGLWG